MQRELRRLAHRTDKQANANDRDQHPAGARQIQLCKVVGFSKYLAIVQCAGVGSNQADAEDKTEVTHAVDEEGLHVGKNCSGLVEVKPDQQIRHQADSFPAEKQLQHVVAHDQHQHGKREQRDIAKETVVTVFFFHVADRVNMHHQRDKSHHAHHHGGEAIHQKANFHFQSTDHHPGVQRFIEARAICDHAVKRHGRENESHQHAQNRQRVRQTAAHQVAAKGRTKNTGNQSTGKRQQRHCQECGNRKSLTHYLTALKTASWAANAPAGAREKTT